jgi:FkbM family methyltransferase
MLSAKVQRILNVTQNPVIVELGACDGRYTQAIFMSCLNGSPRIISFEPDPRNIELYAKQALPIVEFYAAAVGNITGKTVFHLASPQPNGEIGSSSLSEFKDLTAAFPWCKHEGDVEVNCWRLDDFCGTHRITYIDLVFADVQGAELLVVEGAQNILRHTHYLWTEFEGRWAFNHGTLYKDSCSLEQIKAALPGEWSIAEIWGGDALLVNEQYMENSSHPAALRINYEV